MATASLNYGGKRMELIDKKEMLEQFDRRVRLMVGDDKYVSVESFRHFIENRPTVDVVEVKIDRGVKNKTPEEIKKSLECCAVNACYGDYDDCPYRGLPICVQKMTADALVYINYLEESADTFMKAVSKWISVEDRLPDDAVDVLVYAVGKNEGSVIAMTNYTHHMHGYNIEGWRSPWRYFFHEYKITHWMELPEKPIDIKRY